MKRYQKLGMYKLIILLLLFVASCNSHTIKLDVVRKSSDLLHCQRIYGYDAKSLYERNEILIQVGVIDTTTEQAPIRAAIIVVNKMEIVLNLELDSVLSNHTIEKYSGDDYQLTLDYSTKKDERYSGKNIYVGTCTITNDMLTSRYEIVGIVNPDY